MNHQFKNLAILDGKHMYGLQLNPWNNIPWRMDKYTTRIKLYVT